MLKKRFHKLALSYCLAFEKQTGISFEEYITPDMTFEILSFGDFYFSFDEVRYVVDNEVDTDLLIQYWDDCMANYESGKRINLPSYVKGSRYEKI